MEKFFIASVLFFSLYSLYSAEYNSAISLFSRLQNDGTVISHSASKSETPLSHFISKNIFSLPITQENIADKCIQFLLANNAITMQDNLRLLSAKLHRKQWYVNFVQTHNGLTVLNSNTNLQVFENGNLMHVRSSYFSEVTKHNDLQPIDLIDTTAMKQVAISKLDKINFVRELDFIFYKQCILPVTVEEEMLIFV